MSRIFTNGNRIRGDNATAAGVLATDFPVYQQFLKGADLASGGTITPGIEQRFHLTGTTPVNFIGLTNVLDGREFAFYVTAGVTLNHNTASPPVGTAPMKLITGANTAVPIGRIVVFQYDASVGACVQVSGTNDGVLSVSAGTGISITGTGANPVVNNTGVLSVSAGTGISITGTGANPVVNNTGVLSVGAGTGGISIGGTGANPVVNFPVLTTDEVAFSNGSSLVGDTGFKFNATKGLYLSHRLQEALDSATLSGNTITLGANGNFHVISLSAADIHGISLTNWQSGSRARVELSVASGSVLRHLSASPGTGAAPLYLGNGLDITLSAGKTYVLDLTYDGTTLGCWVQSGASGPQFTLAKEVDYFYSGIWGITATEVYAAQATLDWVAAGEPAVTTEMAFPLPGLAGPSIDVLTLSGFFSRNAFAFNISSGLTFKVKRASTGAVIATGFVNAGTGGVGQFPILNLNIASFALTSSDSITLTMTSSGSAGSGTLEMGLNLCLFHENTF